eukprot:927563-Pelagomonas_calceolata.AAC.3
MADKQQAASRCACPPPHTHTDTHTDVPASQTQKRHLVQPGYRAAGLQVMHLIIQPANSMQHPLLLEQHRQPLHKPSVPPPWEQGCLRQVVADRGDALALYNNGGRT